MLAAIDGNPGLEAPLQATWPQLDVQRCINHKLWNLLAKAPVHLREGIAEHYRRMIYAATVAEVGKARTAFGRKWKLRYQAAWSSFEEAGDRLFTSLRYPVARSKALRTTNALERITEEFRRRTKTQASLPSEDAVPLLLFGLMRSGRTRCGAWSAGRRWQRSTDGATRPNRSDIITGYDAGCDAQPFSTPHQGLRSARQRRSTAGVPLGSGKGTSRRTPAAFNDAAAAGASPPVRCVERRAATRRSTSCADPVRTRAARPYATRLGKRALIFSRKMSAN